MCMDAKRNGKGKTFFSLKILICKCIQLVKMLENER